MKEQTCLSWMNHQNLLKKSLCTFRETNTFCDVTLACSGKYFPAHRLILSTSSEYFKEILEQAKCSHPFIIIRGITVEDLECLLDFIYNGSVTIPKNQISSLIHAAADLKISGLNLSSNNDDHEIDLGNDYTYSPISLKKDPKSTAIERGNTDPRKTVITEESSIGLKLHNGTHTRRDSVQNGENKENETEEYSLVGDKTNGCLSSSSLNNVSKNRPTVSQANKGDSRNVNSSKSGLCNDGIEFNNDQTLSKDTLNEDLLQAINGCLEKSFVDLASSIFANLQLKRDTKALESSNSDTLSTDGRDGFVPDKNTNAGDVGISQKYKPRSRNGARPRMQKMGSAHTPDINESRQKKALKRTKTGAKTNIVCKSPKLKRKKIHCNIPNVGLMKKRKINIQECDFSKEPVVVLEKISAQSQMKLENTPTTSAVQDNKEIESGVETAVLTENETIWPMTEEQEEEQIQLALNLSRELVSMVCETVISEENSAGDTSTKLDTTEAEDMTSSASSSLQPGGNDSLKIALGKKKKVKKSNGNMFRCLCCNFKSSKKVALVNHSKTHWYQEKKIKCEFCPYKAAHPSYMKTHMNKHSESGKHKCKYCSFTCRKFENLIEHQKSLRCLTS